jgi:prophage antirepressor-like protein
LASREYKEVSRTLAKLDDDEKLTRQFVVSGQNRNMLCITESGLYTLILRSDKPEEKPFKRWVTHEVLPMIRKTGSYSTDGSQEFAQVVPVMMEMMNGMNSMMGMMKQILENQVSVTKEHLSPDQLDTIKLAVSKTATFLAEAQDIHHEEAIKRLYRELNGRMGVFTYYHIHANDFEDAIALLEKIRVVQEGKIKAQALQRLIDAKNLIDGIYTELPTYF